MRAPKAILFDLDDTILEFGNRLDVFLATAHHFAQAIAPNDPNVIAHDLERVYESIWTTPDLNKRFKFDVRQARIYTAQTVLEPLGISEAVATEIGEYFHHRREYDISLFPGAIELLTEARRRGIKLALLTNGSSEVQRTKVSRFDLARYFDHIQIDSEVGFGKPEERAYQFAMDTLQVSAADTWMVGDNYEWEVIGASRLGIFTVWVDRHGKGIPSSGKVVPDMTVHSIGEIELPPEAS